MRFFFLSVYNYYGEDKSERKRWMHWDSSIFSKEYYDGLNENGHTNYTKLQKI